MSTKQASHAEYLYGSNVVLPMLAMEQPRRAIRQLYLPAHSELKFTSPDLKFKYQQAGEWAAARGIPTKYTTLSHLTTLAPDRPHQVTAPQTPLLVWHATLRVGTGAQGGPADARYHQGAGLV